MARIYAGELTKIDVEVVGRLQRELSDEFSVLAELNVGRNVDVVVIRPMGTRPALLVAAELKRVSRPLAGQTDGMWSEMKGDGAWHPIRPSNTHDVNHHWQSVNAADALKRWLWLNQRRFLGVRGTMPGSDVRVWPNLVLYGVPRDAHQLPDEPATRFGSWFFSVDEWVDYLGDCHPWEGMTLRESDVDRLVDALGLLSLPDEAAVSRLAAATEDEDTFASALRALDRRVLALESLLSLSANSPRLGQPEAHPVLAAAATR